MGMLGCLLCIVGSTVIVLHAPHEKSINSVEEIWELAIQPGTLYVHFSTFFLISTDCLCWRLVYFSA
uniref:Probable magnesium transporter n=1 Tax=Rhizophora mucronata TaxID=61149 RepID=A0A2P2MFA1_RHIMU